MRLLLIDIARTSLRDIWPSAEHSLGLMYLSAYLKRQFGDRVEIRIETVISRVGYPSDEQEQMRGFLASFEPDFVGMRTLSIGSSVLTEVADVVKEWREDCPVVVGGPHATDAPEDVLLGARADCAVIGEGELTAADLVERFLSGKGWEGVPGTAVLRNGQVVRGPVREFIADLDALPLPDYSTIDLDKFSNRYLDFASRLSHPHGNLLTTRGCPYACAYCHNILGKRFRARSPESVFGEIRWLHDEFGLTDFQIIDDIFNLDLERAKRILDLIIDSGLNLTFGFPNGVRGDRMDEELIDKLAAAGTRFISYAVETASPRLQKLIRKNIMLDRIFEAIEYTAQTCIATRGFFMIGFPTETEEEARATAQFAVDSSLTGATFFTVVYFPGTELYRIAKSLGYFRDEGAEIRRDYVDVGEGPYEFSGETLREIKQDAIRRFAFDKKRIEEALRLLPGYFTDREIRGLLMAYVVSSGARLEEIEDEAVREHLHRHFAIAERFSRQGAFYV